MSFIKFKDKISKKQAYNKILTYLKYGDLSGTIESSLSNRNRILSADEMVKVFCETSEFREARYSDFEKYVEACRKYSTPIPLLNYTNHMQSVHLLPRKHNHKGNSGSFIVSPEGKETRVDNSIVIQQYYLQLFKLSDSLISESIDEYSIPKLRFGMAAGYASLEVFINEKSKNMAHKLKDSSIEKVSLETKLLEWAPKLAGKSGYTVFLKELTYSGKTDEVWSSFKSIKKIRDQQAIHSFEDNCIISYSEFVKAINDYRMGVVKHLLILHLLFNSYVPQEIINRYYTPKLKI